MSTDSDYNKDLSWDIISWGAIGSSPKGNDELIGKGENWE